MPAQLIAAAQVHATLALGSGGQERADDADAMASRPRQTSESTAKPNRKRIL
jgi:hypothetical protein